MDFGNLLKCLLLNHHQTSQAPETFNIECPKEIDELLAFFSCQSGSNMAAWQSNATENAHVERMCTNTDSLRQGYTDRQTVHTFSFLYFPHIQSKQSGESCGYIPSHTLFLFEMLIGSNSTRSLQHEPQHLFSVRFLSVLPVCYKTVE